MAVPGKELDWAADAEFADAGLQGGAFHAEHVGGAARAGDAPMSLAKGAKDMLALGFLLSSDRSSGCDGERSFCDGSGGSGITYFGKGNVKFLTWRENNRAFQQIFQFANIAGPGVGHQGIHGVRGNVLNGFVQPAAELLHEVADQQRNILAAFAKRRKLNRKNVEAVEKIAAEFAFGVQTAKIGVGGGDHANVHANGAGGAQAFEFMFLQNAKKFRLQFEWDVADFIQENGATVGEFEAANFLRDGAGERTTFMTEEFAFEQAGRDSGTIDFDESAFAARTQIVDGASDELFAGAGFAENEHGGVTWRGVFNLP